jgi:hypothetical protein
MTEPTEHRRWPSLSEEQERELLQLERIMDLPSTTTTSWTEKIPKLGHWGYRGHDQFKDVEVTRDLEPEEKHRMKRNLVAKLYASIEGNEAAEQIARAIIAAGGKNPAQT